MSRVILAKAVNQDAATDALYTHFPKLQSFQSLEPLEQREESEASRVSARRKFWPLRGLGLSRAIISS